MVYVLVFAFLVLGLLGLSSLTRWGKNMMYRSEGSGPAGCLIVLMVMVLFALWTATIVHVVRVWE